MDVHLVCSCCFSIQQLYFAITDNSLSIVELKPRPHIPALKTVTFQLRTVACTVIARQWLQLLNTNWLCWRCSFCCMYYNNPRTASSKETTQDSDINSLVIIMNGQSIHILWPAHSV